MSQVGQIKDRIERLNPADRLRLAAEFMEEARTCTDRHRCHTLLRAAHGIVKDTEVQLDDLLNPDPILAAARATRRFSRMRGT